MDAISISLGKRANGRRLLPFAIALVGISTVWLMTMMLPHKPPMLAALLLFGIGFGVLMFLPALQAFPVASRIVLILLTLRPILDLTQTEEISSSGLPLQNAFALIFAAFVLWVTTRMVRRNELTAKPNVFLLVLAGLGVIAWLEGGLGAGANSFIRTEWGLLIALLIGAIPLSDHQIDLFIRTAFYSSILVLLVLLFNLDQGEYLGDVWRLGGQFIVPNTLAAVAFSLFAFGLYTLSVSTGLIAKVLSSTVLVLLATVILATQSRTVGGLLILSVCFWFWACDRIKISYVVAGALAVILMSSVTSDWRLLSSFSFDSKELGPEVVNMTGRTFLWGKTLETYLEAGILHKFVGLGWGTVFDNFAPLGLEKVSSVTENSFLWFLVGSGLLGLAAFSSYLGWVLWSTVRVWRRAKVSFEHRLGCVAFLVALTFLVEGFTTDLVLSPVANVYLYTAISLFVWRRIRAVVPTLMSQPGVQA